MGFEGRPPIGRIHVTLWRWRGREVVANGSGTPDGGGRRRGLLAKETKKQTSAGSGVAYTKSSAYSHLWIGPKLDRFAVNE